MDHHIQSPWGLIYKFSRNTGGFQPSGMCLVRTAHSKAVNSLMGLIIDVRTVLSGDMGSTSPLLFFCGSHYAYIDIIGIQIFEVLSIFLFFFNSFCFSDQIIPIDLTEHFFLLSTQVFFGVPLVNF